MRVEEILARFCVIYFFEKKPLFSIPTPEARCLENTEDCCHMQNTSSFRDFTFVPYFFPNIIKCLNCVMTWCMQLKPEVCIHQIKYSGARDYLTRTAALYLWLIRSLWTSSAMKVMCHFTSLFSFLRICKFLKKLVKCKF